MGRITDSLEDLTWADFEIFLSLPNVKKTYLELSDKYFLRAVNEGFSVGCILLKDSGANQTDFESNYKNDFNKPIYPVDADGAMLSRTKITQTGWAYKIHGIEIETSLLSSIVEKDPSNNNYGYATIKFFNNVGTELTTQNDIDSNCIETQLDWEPNYDYEILGGIIRQTVIPASDIRVNVIGVPDVPSQYGGSKHFVSGINLKFIGTGQGLRVDGIAPKPLTYDVNYHTNKIRFTLFHDAGIKHKLFIGMEIFQA